MSTFSDKQHFEKQIRKNCSRCQTSHSYAMCPAFGTRCSRCSKWNHFDHCCFSNNSKIEVNSSEIIEDSSLDTQHHKQLCCLCLTAKQVSLGLCESCFDKISYTNTSDEDEVETDPPSPLEVSSYSYTIDSETPSTTEITPNSLDSARSLAHSPSPKVSCNSITPKPSD